MLRTSVQQFSSSLLASVLPPSAKTLPSVQPSLFVRFLTFLHWLLSLCIFHTSLSLIFHTSLSPFFFINSCAVSYCLSFLLPDEASGRNVVNSTDCCSTACCSLNYYTSVLLLLDEDSGETLSVLLRVILLRVVLKITSIFFVLDECRTSSLLRTSVQPF